MKKILTYGITLLLLGMIITPSTRTNEVEYSLTTVSRITLYVGGDGPENYTKIQYAIDNASDGDLVFVYNDSSPYFENLVVNVTIDLTSEDRYSTIIDGGENDDVIQINAVSVRINGFNIINGEFGIWYNSISNSTVTNCSIYSNSYNGIRLTSSSNNTIINCSIYSNSRNGIRLTSSSNNTIINCSVNSNIINGIDIEASSKNNLIANCTIYNSTYTGIWIYSSSNNTINSCFIYNSSLYGVKIIGSSIGNLIFNNYFNNICNARDECNNNIWNISKTSGVNIVGGYFLGGNYWSDYNGVDIDGDGLGDTNLPYNSSGYIIYGGDWMPLVVNNPPYLPRNPIPDNGETGVVIDTNLSWAGGDPDPYDNVTYDVYLGNTTPPPQVAWNQTETTFVPSTLEYNTSYYWNIVAWDNHGASTVGPEWHFTTEEINHPPNPPSISGPIMGKVGTSYPYTFTSTDPGGDEIWYYIEWGDGEIEDWIGPYPSGQEIVRSHTWDDRGTYTIRAKAKDIFDAESDWGTLEVTMPVWQGSLFFKLLERFPLLEKMFYKLFL